LYRDKIHRCGLRFFFERDAKAMKIIPIKPIYLLEEDAGNRVLKKK
jgi:hypothetical protein